MSDTTEWPLAETLRMHAARAPDVPVRRRSLPRTAWGLAAAGFVAGLLLSAIAFSIGWRHQAQHGSSTAAALAVARARNHVLVSSLAEVRRSQRQTQTQLVAARRAQARAEASARAVTRQAASLATALDNAGRSANSVSAGAGTLGTSLDKLAGELKTLATYLTTTPTAQLDPGYVASQTSYLTKQLEALQASREDLVAAIAQFEAGTQKLTSRAATLSAAN